ncbi:hypothetical protein HDU93_002120 [Gonapodya sp. JEL0774]|nr:hypothetical protein HDU93_002120 [Gonapodya sp. JEL0774]
MASGMTSEILIPSLQTWVGMVMANGAPSRRSNPVQTDMATPLPVSVDRNTAICDLTQDTVASAGIPSTSPSMLKTLTASGISAVSTCIAGRGLPQNARNDSAASRPTESRQIGLDDLTANIQASIREDITPSLLKKYINTRKRLDIEQAAALVLSLLGPPSAALVEPLRVIFASSNMWLESKDYPPERTLREEVYHRALTVMHGILKGARVNEVNLISTTSPTFAPDILTVLLRVRRIAPLPQTRCLRLPPWLFEFARVPPPDHIADHEAYTGQRTHSWPTAVTDSPIVISRNNFRRIDHRLQRLRGPTDPASLLGKDIGALDDYVTFGLRSEAVLQNTQDSLALAYSFFALQRQFQPKVVSDIGWTTFLKKGESGTVQQNTPGTPTTFELELLRLATSRPVDQVDWDALTAVRIPAGLEGLSGAYNQEERVIEALDKACLLAEKYILIHGGGKFDALTFKMGKSGGSGRGPVDQYNLLVDKIRQLKSMWIAAKGGAEEAEEEARDRQQDRTEPDNATDVNPSHAQAPVPLVEITADTPLEPTVVGPCHKFLAKDIIAWNNAWNDDAFAGGKRPGWLRWLKLRRLRGDIPLAEVELK